MEHCHHDSPAEGEERFTVDSLPKRKAEASDNQMKESEVVKILRKKLNEEMNELTSNQRMKSLFISTDCQCAVSILATKISKETPLKMQSRSFTHRTVPRK